MDKDELLYNLKSVIEAAARRLVAAQCNDHEKFEVLEVTYMFEEPANLGILEIIDEDHINAGYEIPAKENA